jgi:hypothetical protein
MCALLFASFGAFMSCLCVYVSLVCVVCVSSDDNDSVAEKSDEEEDNEQ